MRKKLLRSRTGFEKPESREEAIMQNILGASNVLEPSESNIEEILKSILYNTPYTKEAESEIEKILLAIKNNGTYDGEGESRDMKILISILRDLNYTEEAESRIEELFIEWLYQRSSIKVLEGVPPLTFTSLGLPLINYLIEGNTVQNSIPTPSAPIHPSECGELVTSGAHAGEYVIPIVSGGVTTNVYLSEPLRKIGDYADTIAADGTVTRKIKKRELTENENWEAQGTPSQGTNQYFRLQTTFADGIVGQVLCSHYVSPVESISVSNTVEGVRIQDSSTAGRILIIRPPTYATDTVDTFKRYLASEYANGTPVTVWYVLADPTTETVTAPPIPTTRGTATIDVYTTLKPSNVYIEYK